MNTPDFTKLQERAKELNEPSKALPPQTMPQIDRRLPTSKDYDLYMQKINGYVHQLEEYGRNLRRYEQQILFYQQDLDAVMADFKALCFDALHLDVNDQASTSNWKQCLAWYHTPHLHMEHIFNKFKTQYI